MLSSDYIQIYQIDKRCKNTQPYCELNLKLEHLKELILCERQISSIGSNTFLELVNLKILNLFENKITQLNTDSFNGLNNLHDLNLSNNQIT